MAEEVAELEERLSDLTQDMRAVCVLAARSPRDAEQMAGVLRIVSSIERVANAAVDVARIVTHRLGIPNALVADLAAAEEVSHRVRIREDSAMAHRTLADLSLTTEVGMRVVALRRGKEWTIDPDGEEVLRPADVLILRGASAGIPELRELAGAPEWRPGLLEEDTAVTDLDRAVDVLVEMKNVSEVAVGPGLLGRALQRRRTGRRGHPPRGPPRRDEGTARGVGPALARRTPSTRPPCAGSCTSARRPRRSATPPSRWCGWSRRARRSTPSWPTPSARATR